MSPINKEDIINTGYEITRYKGIEGVNARTITKNLNCYIQPIFHNF